MPIPPGLFLPCMTTRVVRSNWRNRAACRGGVDPELFFPAGEDGPVYDAQVAAAKAVCARCPVRAACLDEALARIPFGIAGGLTPEERRGYRSSGSGLDTCAGSDHELLTEAGRAEREAAGRALIVAGRPIAEVARRCGVGERTAARWAARVRAASRTGEGSAGGNRAPLQISHTTDTQPGTRTQEGADPR